MRKFCYQLTIRVLPVYFIVLMITIIVVSLFSSAPQAHGQMVDISRLSNDPVLAIKTENSTAVIVAATTTSHFADRKLDKTQDEMTFSSNSTTQFLNISFNRQVTNIIVFDLSNNVVDGVVTDIPNKRVDYSSICQGVYYVRVDYLGGSMLKRVILE